MSNSVQSSAANEPGPSLASRYPRTTTLAAAAGLFVVSTGLLYATTLAVAVVGVAPVAVLAASSWLLSVVVLALIARPHFHRLKTRTRPVPEGLRGSVAETCARNGVAVRRSWLTAAVPGFGMAGIVGVPWDRHFVVDEWFFASLAPAERRALAAREAALVRSRYRPFRHAAGPTIVAGVAGVLAVASFAPFGGFTGASASLLLGAASAGLYALAARRGAEKVHAADRHAAERTNVEAAVGLLEKAAAQREESVWDRWPLSLLVMCPTTSQRIARLQAPRD